jgi:uroporphyrinogen-III synthase
MSKQLDGILGRATRATASEIAPRVALMPASSEPDALLQARVPASVVDAVKLLAAQNKSGWTVRRVLLEALKAYGISVPEEALCYRRK